MNGVLVGVTSREYKAFKDDQGREVAGGKVYALFLGTEDFGAPIEVRCDAEAHGQAKAAGFGAHVKGIANLYARGNRIERKLISESSTITA